MSFHDLLGDRLGGVDLKHSSVSHLSISMWYRGKHGNAHITCVLVLRVRMQLPQPENNSQKIKVNFPA